MRKNAELIVGLTVIVGLSILLFGILWGKNYRLASNQVTVGFLFQNTSGLRVNDPVTVNGVSKGQVAGKDKGISEVEQEKHFETIRFNEQFRYEDYAGGWEPAARLAPGAR